MKKIALLIISVAMVSCSSNSSEESLGVHYLQIYADSLFQVNVDSAMIAGASVIVQQGNERLVQRNYGFASLELEAPMPENPSFEIGSITKQFTAAAILRLAETGKLSLEDDISKYLELNTGGRDITIYQLLNHTSGIPSYTEIPDFWPMSLHSYPRDTMFSVIENNEFLFEPGTQMIYNNSAYFLLGLIIEKQSEMDYEAYLKQEFFEPLGMSHTYYCTTSEPVKGKVYGYAYSPEGLNQKDYLDHTWPYAAGSLCSTAEDLMTWLTALHTGKVFDEEGYAQMITPRTLDDGTPLRYAMGLAHHKDNGIEMIQHGGGINGFLSESRYYPEEDLYVVCLVNTTGPMNPDKFSDLLTWKVIDKKEPATMELDPGLADFSGTYEGQVRGSRVTIDLTLNEDGLIIEQEQRDPDTIRTYIGNNTFMDGNNIITIREGSATFDQVYGFYTLKKM